MWLQYDAIAKGLQLIANKYEDFESLLHNSNDCDWLQSGAVDRNLSYLFDGRCDLVYSGKVRFLLACDLMWGKSPDARGRMDVKVVSVPMGYLDTIGFLDANEWLSRGTWMWGCWNVKGHWLWWMDLGLGSTLHVALSWMPWKCSHHFHFPKHYLPKTTFITFIVLLFSVLISI